MTQNESRIFLKNIQINVQIERTYFIFSQRLSLVLKHPILLRIVTGIHSYLFASDPLFILTTFPIPPLLDLLFCTSSSVRPTFYVFLTTSSLVRPLLYVLSSTSLSVRPYIGPQKIKFILVYFYAMQLENIKLALVPLVPSLVLLVPLVPSLVLLVPLVPSLVLLVPLVPLVPLLYLLYLLPECP